MNFESFWHLCMNFHMKAFSEIAASNIIVAGIMNDSNSVLIFYHFLAETEVIARQSKRKANRNSSI